MKTGPVGLANTWHSVPDRFAHHTRANPHAVAVQAQDGSLSYAELQLRIDMLARRIDQRLGDGERLVALCLERVCDLPAWVMAILKAGAAYLPLDPTLPPARIAQMLDDGRPALVLVSASLRDCLPETHIPVFLAEEEGAVRCEGWFADRSARGNLAYVMYTSGSTGVPKGVEIEHGSITALIDACTGFSNLGPGKKLLSLTRLSFDMSVFELFLPLCTGASLVLSSCDHGASPHALAAAIEHHRPDVLQATPATWRLLLATGWVNHRPARILCGGEAMSRDLADQLIETCEELWNLYGPTEATVWASAQQVMRGGATISVGHAIAEWGIIVVDAAGCEQSKGDVGEIAICGPGLARGYRGLPDLTAQRFVRLSNGTRAYLTGDLGRIGPGGALYCLGRLDHQVKIRGYRIELGDVENAMDAHPDITWAAAKAWPDASGENILAGYYVASTPEPDTAVVRQFLSSHLPPYMLPDRLIALDSMPLNANGKVDRAALPNPLAVRPVDYPETIVAQSSFEVRLAAIWRSLLNLETVGTEDDFFALGGYSLLTVQLLCAIEEEFGCRLATTDLLQAPSLRSMAQRIGSDESSPSVMLLNRDSTRPPLYWVDAGPLIRHVALQMDDQPVYALNLTAQDEAAFEGKPLDVSQIAATLRGHLLQVQPHGPYYLAGWCRWAIVAHELSCQLENMGEEVRLLVNLAGEVPGTRRPLKHRIPNMLKLRMGDHHATGHVGWTNVVRRALRTPPETALRLRPNVSQRVQKEAQGFRPHVFQGDMVLIEPLGEANSAYAAWRGVVAGMLTVQQVSGTHVSMVRGDEASILAMTINAMTKSAQTKIINRALMEMS